MKLEAIQCQDGWVVTITITKIAKDFEKVKDVIEFSKLDINDPQKVSIQPL